MKLVDFYKPEKTYKFDFPITAFSGIFDNEIPYEDSVEWKKYTLKDFNSVLFEGDHFFPFKKTIKDKTYFQIKKIINNISSIS